ncbi:MAG: hypothetical protein ACLPID_11600 [Beijerinckiaceae bacterium]
MPATDLKPVERGALFVLMAEGRPLKESAELKTIHGIALTPNHRKKLIDLGLIKTTKKPFFTHALTEKGWKWANEEITAAKPKGLMGMGPLYAVLGGMRRHLERHGYSLKDVFSPQDGDGAREHMREAAWSEADEALAQALQDLPVFTTAMEKLKAAPNGGSNDTINRTSAAAKLVMQSVQLAGRKRELALVLKSGEETIFDPALHRSDDSPRPGDRVRIRKPPVIRGTAHAKVVVIAGEVEAI